MNKNDYVDFCNMNHSKYESIECNNRDLLSYKSSFYEMNENRLSSITGLSLFLVRASQCEISNNL